MTLESLTSVVVVSSTHAGFFLSLRTGEDLTATCMWSAGSDLRMLARAERFTISDGTAIESNGLPYTRQGMRLNPS